MFRGGRTSDRIWFEVPEQLRYGLSTEMLNEMLSTTRFPITVAPAMQGSGEAPDHVEGKAEQGQHIKTTQHET